MAIWIEANQRKVGSEIEPKCLILISNLELQLKPAATAGFSSIFGFQKVAGDLTNYKIKYSAGS